MKVAELLARRQSNWRELETIIAQAAGSVRQIHPQVLLRLGERYRDACADLALAQAYRLPEETVHYLHQLVAAAHNVVYRSERFQLWSWGRILFVEVPGRLRRDGCLWVVMALFWGAFLGSGFAAYVHDGFARDVAGEEVLAGMSVMYSDPIEGRDLEAGTAMAGFYILNNPSIGLRCFAMGIFLGIGSIAEVAFNAIFLGTIFGYMAGTPQAPHFYEFVTAHGPFELTAIVFSGAAGLRLGFSLVATNGLARGESLRRQARRAFEVAATGLVLFVLAAFIEAFISPSGLPYAFKAAVALISAALLAAYLGLLGRGLDAAAALPFRSLRFRRRDEVAEHVGAPARQGPDPGPRAEPS